MNNSLILNNYHHEIIINKFYQICFLSRKVLEGLGYNVPEAELTTFINHLDIDKSG